MEKESMNTVLMLAVVAVVLIATAFAVKAIIDWQYGSRYQPELSGRVSDVGSAPQGSNIKSAQPTPSSCTPTQNCGSPTCAAAQGTGGCGCGR